MVGKWARMRLGRMDSWGSFKFVDLRRSKPSGSGANSLDPGEVSIEWIHRSSNCSIVVYQAVEKTL